MVQYSCTGMLCLCVWPFSVQPLLGYCCTFHRMKCTGQKTTVDRKSQTVHYGNIGGQHRNNRSTNSSTPTLWDLRDRPGPHSQRRLPLLCRPRTAVLLKLRCSELAHCVRLLGTCWAVADHLLEAQKEGPTHSIADDGDLSSCKQACWALTFEVQVEHPDPHLKECMVRNSVSIRAAYKMTGSSFRGGLTNF